MQLAFTAEQDEFRAQARAWLEANVPDEPLPSMDTAEGFAAHREWERRLHAAGWAVVSWPTEYGGRGCDLVEWLIFEEEYYRAGGPGRVGQNGLFLFAPTLMEYGTDEQKARFLPRMAAADDIWAQGWSEPNAGSDLAAIRARADRDGDEWVVSGQKTWCSRGAFADWLFGLFRTDPDSERHRGLSFLMLPLDAEGVTVRPIRQLDGETGFAEVFLDEVRIPIEANTVGEIDQGWRVAMSTVGFERGVSLRSPGRFSAAAQRLLDLYRREGGDDPVLGEAVVRSWMETEAYRLNTFWIVSRLMAGGSIGAEASLNKLFWSQMDLRLHERALAIAGDRMDLTGAAPEAIDGGAWLDGFLFSLAGPIYAGTNEIQRNIIAERVLGLPRK